MDLVSIPVVSSALSLFLLVWWVIQSDECLPMFSHTPIFNHELWWNVSPPFHWGPLKCLQVSGGATQGLYCYTCLPLQGNSVFLISCHDFKNYTIVRVNLPGGATNNKFLTEAVALAHFLQSKKANISWSFSSVNFCVLSAKHTLEHRSHLYTYNNWTVEIWWRIFLVLVTEILGFSLTFICSDNNHQDK